MLRQFFRSDQDAMLDALIDDVMLKMSTIESDTPEYQPMLEALERLQELKTKRGRKPLSMDNLVMVGGNLVIVFIVVAFEQNHVMRTTAMSLLFRPKAGATN